MEIEKLGVKVHRDTHTFFVGAMSPGLSGYSGSSGYLGGALKVTSRPDGWQTFPQLPISDSRIPNPRRLRIRRRLRSRSRSRRVRENRLEMGFVGQWFLFH